MLLIPRGKGEGFGANMIALRQFDQPRVSAGRDERTACRTIVKDQLRLMLGTRIIGSPHGTTAAPGLAHRGRIRFLGRCGRRLYELDVECGRTSERQIAPVCGPLARTHHDVLELGCFREIEVADLHRRNHHVHRLFAAGALRFAHGLNILQHANQALVEAKVANTVADLPALD